MCIKIQPFFNKFKKKTHYLLTNKTQDDNIKVSKNDTKKEVDKMNKKLLQSFMVKNGDSGIILSKKMNISQQTFSAKINEKNGKEFTKSEINFMIERYNLKPNDVIDIFFKREVS